MISKNVPTTSFLLIPRPLNPTRSSFLSSLLPSFLLPPFLFTDLVSAMTPALRGDVASELYGNWLHRVTWLRDASNPFLESLALALKPALYPTGELVNGEYVYDELCRWVIRWCD